MQFLEKLSNADALAGNEDEVRKLMYENMKSADEIFCDKLGSIIFKLKGKSDSPKIMFAAHMDEVGFVVKNILENGQILLKQFGSVKPLARFMQPVRITNSKGKKIKGLLNSNFNEDMKIKDIQKDSYVDIGAKSDKQVEKMGIEIGNMVTFDSSFEIIDSKNTVCGKAFDDRIGCYIISRVFNNLKKSKPASDIYFAITSSEEVGLRGSKTAVSAINPDVAFVIDSCCNNDSFDYSNKNPRQIGKGMILTLSDRGVESNKTLVNMINNTAKKLKKNIQHDMLVTGGTDGINISLNGDGVPTVVCCVPLRYGHCAYSIADKNDIEDAIEILTNVLKNFSEKDYKKCINFI